MFGYIIPGWLQFVYQTTPVQVATVVGDWNSLSTEDDHDGYTDPNGIITIPSPKVDCNLEGEFCFVVTEITKPNGWAYAIDTQFRDTGFIYTSQWGNT